MQLNETMENSLQRRLDEALSEWPQWSSVIPVVLRQLKGGLTNDIFLLQSHQQQLVLRLNTVNSVSLGLNRWLEHEVLQQTQTHQLSAQLIYFDPQQRYLVTEYIVGGHWQRSDNNDANKIVQLAQLIRSVHQLQPVDGFLDIPVRIENYWRSIDCANALLPVLIALKPRVQLHIDAAVHKNVRACVCHNDLVPNNLLVATDQRLYAIDWEYAAMGDPYFDLATVAEEYALDQQQFNQLLVAYSDDGLSPLDTQRLLHNRVIYSYVCLLWYVACIDPHSDGMPRLYFQDKLSCLHTLLDQFA
jgi:thiamine kinase